MKDLEKREQEQKMFVKRLTRAAAARAGGYTNLSVEIGATEANLYKWANGTSTPKATYLLSLLTYMGMIIPEGKESGGEVQASQMN